MHDVLGLSLRRMRRRRRRRLCDSMGPYMGP